MLVLARQKESMETGSHWLEHKDDTQNQGKKNDGVCRLQQGRGRAGKWHPPASNP